MKRQAGQSPNQQNQSPVNNYGQVQGQQVGNNNIQNIIGNIPTPPPAVFKKMPLTWHFTYLITLALWTIGSISLASMGSSSSSPSYLEEILMISDLGILVIYLSHWGYYYLISKKGR